ncbi:DUF983 domain-containing protein [Telluribacter sp. SYSU D00476]|uniref:DUF983 domain-containing protein n=1 Tax=Telluribacter sp. SYSU D00476 TaxID=2811430 RepID=UPI001FF228AE|nr:DUF983 domain-containing protein [Telluribacter sp. SYSU D00476]
MSSNKSTFYSIINARCPRCHEGDMFPTSILAKPTKFRTMNKECTCCGQNLEPEPGYYWGAMFVSYAINTALFVAVWVALGLIVEQLTVTMMVTSLLFISIFFLPYIFRLSRAAWIAIFIPYEGPSNQIEKKHRWVAS